MANILDYLDWRGDVPMEADGFNEVDNLILAELSFLDCSGIVPWGGGGIALSAAARAFDALPDGARRSTGVLSRTRVPELLRRAGETKRFGGVRAMCYESLFSQEREQQFAAISFALPDGTCYLAFRGTDDTLVGWKEDFNMSFLDTIPSQASALDYTGRVAALTAPMPLRIGGHSKGGNLAIYSAVFASEAVQQRIVQVYNNDGPGFNRDLSVLDGHRRVAERIRTFQPQSSVIGMLMENERGAAVVHSTGVGIGQHNGFTWEVCGTQFVRCDDFSAGGKRSEETMDSFAAKLDAEQRKVFVQALFEVLEGTGAQTLSDLSEDRLKKASGMLKTYQSLDEPTREALSGAMKLLLKLNAKSIWQDVRDRLREL